MNNLNVKDKGLATHNLPKLNIKEQENLKYQKLKFNFYIH